MTEKEPKSAKGRRFSADEKMKIVEDDVSPES